MPAEILATVGLALDIIGIVTLFVFAPEKYPNPQSAAFFALEGGEKEKWEVAQSKRRLLTWIAVKVIVTGFTLQAIAVWV